MIYGALSTAYKYDIQSPVFQTAFAFLRRDDLDSLPLGWIDLEHGVRASVQEYTTQPESELYFETHELLFDIHYMVRGEEKIGVCIRDGLVTRIPYNEGSDVQFYEDPAQYSTVYLREGDYTVVGYEDAHKPRIAAGNPMPVRKIVIKIPV